MTDLREKRFFDQREVLEKIISDIPVLSNRREVREIHGQQRSLYAYYSIDGFPDPEIRYDKEEEPIATTEDSTICEVYSAGEENDIALYRGPNIEAPVSSNFIPVRVRMEENPYYDFSRFPDKFQEHFNKICSELGYEYQPHLIDLYDNDNIYGSFAMGSYAIEVAQNIEIITDTGESGKGIRVLRSPIDINFERSDPTLSEVLDKIASSYETAMNPVDTNVTLEVYVFKSR